MNLVEEIIKRKGTNFIGLTVETPVKLKGGKKNPLQGRVTKVVEHGNCIICNSEGSSLYKNMIRKRLLKEGKNPDDYTPGKMPWGRKVPGTPFIEHKGQLYLQVIFLHPGKTTYFVDGKPTPKEEIEGIPETKMSEESQGGLEDKVVIRTIKVDNIKEIKIDGQDIVNPEWDYDKVMEYLKES